MAQTLAAGDDDTPHSTQDQQNYQAGGHGTPANPPLPEPNELRIRPGSLDEMLATVPHLLGFVPQDSLVIIGTGPPRDRVAVTLRYDLPDPAGAGVSADIAAHAAGVIGSQRLTAITAVAYGPEALVDPLAEAFGAAAWKARLDLRDFIRVENNRYWSYVCRDETCCPPGGTPFDPAGYPAAAALDRPGRGVLADRSAVAARVAPVGGIAAVSMRQATRRAEAHSNRLLKKVRKSSRLGAARRMIAAEGLNAVKTMIGTYRAGGRYTTDYEVAWVTVALKDLRVRDDAWARMEPRFTDAHRRLWADVTRRAQPGHVAAPASLLAFVAWQSGDGALANVALDRALADDPSYSMAMLLRQVISAGTPPSMARLPMTPEEVAASYDDAEDLRAEDFDAEDVGDADDGGRHHDDQTDHDMDLDVRHLGIGGES
jgi:hypothetical protein